jgi:flagellin
LVDFISDSLVAGFTDMRASALGLEALSADVGDSTGVVTEYKNGVTTVTANLNSTKLNVSSQLAANAAINVIDSALQKALDLQTKIGAQTSRLEYTSANLVMNSENTQASESVIRDADMAKVQTAYARDSILTQAAQAMLAQSNQNSSSVLSLLQ